MKCKLIFVNHYRCYRYYHRRITQSVLIETGYFDTRQSNGIFQPGRYLFNIFNDRCSAVEFIFAYYAVTTRLWVRFPKQTFVCMNIHIYHSRFTPEGVAKSSQIFHRDTHFLPKLLRYEEYNIYVFTKTKHIFQKSL
jgi:hypothetical protein